MAHPPRTALFTIVAKNYLHYARTLVGSMAAVHPDWDAHVLLADREDGYLDPAREPYRLARIDELPIPELRKFQFRYSILELSTAVKPWFFRRLFASGYDRVLYLDPDIFAYAPLAEVDAAWERGALAVLTPHLTGRIRDDRKPGEREILLAGAYNLGFLGLARHRALDGLLDYWCEKSLREFVVDVHRGLFTDQRWMDLVPGMFPDIAILRHEGYNVAYWNLPQRRVERDGAGFAVNGVPLVFFHFSGVDGRDPETFSRHQDRYRLADVGAVADLVRDYAKTLVANGLEACESWPYAFGALADGTPVPPVVRAFYNASADFRQRAGADPFALDAGALCEPCDRGLPPMSWIMRAVHEARPDLQRAFPDPTGADRVAFAHWFVAFAETEHHLPACWVDPTRQALHDGPPPARPSAVAPGLRAVFGGAARKALVALREGRLPIQPARWLELFRAHRAELQPVREPARRRLPAVPVGAATGVSVLGYLSDATGVAQSALASASAFAAAGVPCELLDVRSTAPLEAAHAVAVIHVNADQFPIVADQLGPAFFHERYVAAVWHWELEEFPDEWRSSFDHVDEVWAASQFLQRNLAAISPVPVVYMPHCVTVPNVVAPDRASFGLPADRFLFLVMYDMRSVQERKNPTGALEAFRRAFPEPGRAGIVVKVNHAAASPDDFALLQQHVARTPGAILLDETLPRQRVELLQAACDAYVSLHRAEGFGFNIAECMLLGKPVVATHWSGNADFMDHRNSCPVGYELVTLTRDHGPYRAGQRWAEPDIDEAAAYMRRLRDEPDFASAIAARGRATIAERYSPAVVGARYRRRLEALRHFR